MLFVIVLFAILVVVTPFTVEIKVTPKDNDCRHVLVTTWFGNIRHVDAKVCGDQKIQFMGKTFDAPNSENPKE